MVKLKRLKIERYRDVEPCELRFSDRFNVLLGPNGAGKTTLLELISKVLRTNLAEPGDPFWLEVELEFEGSSLAGTVKTVTGPDVVPLHLKGDLSASLASRSAGAPASSWPDLDLRWRGRDPATLTRIHGNSDSIVIKRDGDPRELKRPLHEVEYFLRHDLLSTLTVLAQPLSQNTSMERLRNVARFDESLDTYRALTARQGDPVLVGQFLRPLIEATWMLEPQDSARQPKSMFAIEGMVPASMLRLMSDLFSGRAADIMLDNAGLENAGAAFLSMVARLLGLRSAHAKVEFTDKVVQDARSYSVGDTELRIGKRELFWFGNLKFWFTRRDGSIFQDQHLSYGQKRLLAFLYYLDANPSIVIADELVNGLHHAWIEECVKAIGDRQAFLTSQNPLLLDYLVFESVEQVKETFILCRTEPDGDRDRMIWRNMNDDEADMFYSAYKVGVEHVGEILRTRGLW